MRDKREIANEIIKLRQVLDAELGKNTDTGCQEERVIEISQRLDVLIVDYTNEMINKQ